MQKPLPPMQNAATRRCDPAVGSHAWLQETSPGLLLSANRQLANGHQHRLHSQPGLRLIMLLQGELSLRFDQQHFLLRSSAQTPCPILLLGSREPLLFERLTKTRGQESKVCMTISADWLEQHGLLELGDYWPSVVGRQTVQSAVWSADAELQNLGRQLLLHQACNPQLSRLERECLAMQLLGKVMALVQPTAAMAMSHAARRLSKVKSLLDSGEAGDWGMCQLAEAACMSSSTLQRYFRREYGCSVMDYARGLRLERARDQLVSGQGSITRVALEAGYNSPANFSTAFRRRFGSSPRDCLRHATPSSLVLAD